MIQLLYHISIFRTNVIESAESVKQICKDQSKNPSGLAPVLLELSDLFMRMKPHLEMDGVKYRVPVVSPKTLLHRVQRCYPEFASQLRQHDAHEFLASLLNGIAEELHRVFPKPEGSAHCCFIHDLFQGENISLMQCCGCDSVRDSKETFLNLDIDLAGEDSTEKYLGDLLENRQHLELMKGDERVFCESCHCLQETTRRVLIDADNIPPVLLIQLKRFKYDAAGGLSKMSDKIIFPQTLVLQKGEDEKVFYDLVGCVVHIGRSLDSGHYVSVCKTVSRWCLFNDDYVLSVDDTWLRKIYGGRVVVQDGTEAKVFKSHAYLLAYVRADKLGDEVDHNGVHAFEITASTTRAATSVK